MGGNKCTHANARCQIQKNLGTGKGGHVAPFCDFAKFFIFYKPNIALKIKSNNF